MRGRTCLADRTAAASDDLEKSGDEVVEEVEDGELRLLDLGHYVPGAEENRLLNRRLILGRRDEPESEKTDENITIEKKQIFHGRR